MVEKRCAVCNKIYYPKSNNSKYCSDRCRNDIKNENRRNEVKEIECLICKKRFKTSNIRRKYCSNACNLMAKKIRKSKPAISKVCRYCSETFIVKGKSRNAVYCSKECKRKDWKRDHTEKICRNCNNKFLGDKRQTCCSKKCSYEYTSKQIILKCEICAKKFHVIPSRLNREVKPKFCSEECYRESRRIGITPNCKCDNCGKEKYKAPSLLEKHKYTFCSYECMGVYYEKNNLFSGENNGAHIGSFDKHGKYYGSNWLQQRRNARKRDNYTCQRCGTHEIDYGMELSVHHIIPFVLFDNCMEANELNNLMCVCEPCHRKIHSGDNHHTKFKETYKHFELKTSN